MIRPSWCCVVGVESFSRVIGAGAGIGIGIAVGFRVGDGVVGGSIFSARRREAPSALRATRREMSSGRGSEVGGGCPSLPWGMTTVMRETTVRQFLRMELMTRRIVRIVKTVLWVVGGQMEEVR